MFLLMDSPFKKYIEAEMKKRGWKQSDLARAADVSTAAVSDGLSGRRGIGPKLAAAIARALGVPEEEVYQEAGLLPKPKDQDKWLKRMEDILEEIDNEDDRQILEGMARLIREKKKRTSGRRTGYEGSTT